MNEKTEIKTVHPDFHHEAGPNLYDVVVQTNKGITLHTLACIEDIDKFNSYLDKNAQAFIESYKEKGFFGQSEKSSSKKQDTTLTEDCSCRLF